MSHHCHITGCNAPCPPQYFSCRRHWYMIPQHLRNAIYRHYRPGQCEDWQISHEYANAARAAVRYIAELEGREPNTRVYDMLDPGAKDGNSLEGEVPAGKQGTADQESGAIGLGRVAGTACTASRDDSSAPNEAAPPDETFLDGFPPHQYGCGDDPRCSACGERRDYINRARRPCLATTELSAKFWHLGVAQYGLRVFGEQKPIEVPSKPARKTKKSESPSLF